jgi:hypothetical protein
VRRAVGARRVPIGVGGNTEAEAHSDRRARGRMALVGEDGGVECLIEW